MQRLTLQAAQQYRPEELHRSCEYVQQDALAAAQLRAPLYEDKAVDFLFDKAEISEREVTREEIEAAIEADDDGHVHGPGCGHDHDHDAKPAKKAAAKKPAAKKDAVKDEAKEAKAAAHDKKEPKL